MMQNIEMIPETDSASRAFGRMATSAAVFRISGPGVYNPTHLHELHRMAYANTPFAGRAGHRDGLRFLAQSTVIAKDHPRKPRETYELQVGQAVTVDSQEYVVTAQDFSDPILVAKETA